jgi:DNA polymerase-1
MLRATFDLETDDLLDKLTKIHSLVIRDLDSDKVLSFADQENYFPISEGLEILARLELIVGHNCIKFDIPAIKKLHPDWSPRGIVRDTLVMGRFLWAHVEQGDWARYNAGRMKREHIGKHSLEAWGYRLGVLKGDYAKREDAWKEWSVEMQRYCENDTLVQKQLYLRCEKEIAATGGEYPSELEHELAWYLAQMERNGIPFDMEKALALQSTLSARREELRKELVAQYGSWTATAGKPFVPKRDNKKLGYTKGVPVQKYKTVEFNPASRDHIAKVLTEQHGWVPEEYTDGGKPKVDDAALEKLENIPAAAKIVEYLLVQKRLGQLAEGDQEKAWLAVATNQGREGGLLTGVYHIHGSVNQNGAVTHRATHSYPNLAQVPKVGSEYGQECRELFYVPEGWIMLGADASGLELRCLAHYMARYDDGAYGRLILEGDVHAANRDALGLAGKEGRDKSKTFIYAWLYGAGDWKIGHTLDPLLDNEEKAALGKKKKAQFLKNTPALKHLSEAVKEKVFDPKYLLMPDGRRAWMRHQHAALNTLLQGAGAIICKAWIVEFSRRMTARFGPQGWGGKWAALLWIHDEIEVAVRPEIAEEAKQIAVESIRHITQLFSWRLPLDGEARLGRTWADVH